MVTSFSRMERGHSVALSNGKSAFYQYLNHKDDYLLSVYKENIEKANSYSETFGNIDELTTETDHDIAVEQFDAIFDEVNHRESKRIINRTALLLWNPIVKQLIYIAAETSKTTKQYRELISNYLNSDDETSKEQILAEIMQVETTLNELPQQFSDATGELSDYASNLVTAVLWILFLILCFVMAITMIPVIRSITSSLHRVNETLQDISIGEGDLTVRLPISTKDEIGLLSGNFNIFIEKLQNAISEVINNIEAQTHNTTETKQTLEKLSSMVNQQAASVEEVSSTTHQVMASISQNAENTRQTNELASNVKEAAMQGREAMASAVENSRIIQDKISVIEDIALQTNLLALNAAVEAARAGEHG
ncbi:MAG: methyl-accepting chemotaxis protein, partial [Bacteroidales bacterium]|nr:methyl-accepting chemotaxis protein [Bacteroidales bacterium]